MDNFQSSDFFPDSFNVSLGSSTNMNTVSYEAMVAHTKQALCINIEKEIKKSSFSTYFTSLLEDSNKCINQSIDTVIGLLEDADMQLNDLLEYLNNAVSVLQMLSNFIKNVIESVSMSCCSMKTFPITTGKLIQTVFSHCKNSEPLYGSNLKHVEKQLKDLFRTCHELQLIYLMILEKHFIFDCTEKQEENILIEALEINLEIGEIVQTLDVKTMAEQWKAYTVICEKYSNSLLDKSIYCKSTVLLCFMIESHIKTAFEVGQEDKLVLRSLKVACFTIKILSRMCNIFKNASARNHGHILELFLYIHSNNGAYLELTFENSAQLKSLIHANITNPLDGLLKELLLDDIFLNCLFNYDMHTLSKDDKLLGYMLLVITATKHVTQTNAFNISKHRLMESIYNFLPYCHVWFNIGLKIKETDTSMEQSVGLYEHLLAHTTALAATMNGEEYSILERLMLEAILSTDCYTALFFSNLWTLLARINNRQLLLSQLLSLCRMYQKLERLTLFPMSPQHVHLRYTINNLFQTISNEDRVNVYKQFNINDERNINLWIVLRIDNLPENIQSSFADTVLQKFKRKFDKLTTVENNIEEFNNLIKIMKLAATCSSTIDDYLMKAWAKACPKYTKFVKGDLNKGILWYFEYVEALVHLTDSMESVFHYRSDYVVKVLHVVSNIIVVGNTELKLALIGILCKLALLDIHDDNKNVEYSIVTKTFEYFFHDTDHIVRNIFLDTLSKYNRNRNISKIISEVISEDQSLREIWNNYMKYGYLQTEYNMEFKEYLMETRDSKYCHKCIETYVIELNDTESVKQLTNTSSKNFDFADIDMLFDADSDSEPVSKKVKLNNDEAEAIIIRLESDTSLLCKVKENIFTTEHKTRIKDVCDKLRNIIS